MLELNLFYEQQQIQRDKDLDPVRITIVGGTLLVLAIGLWAGMIYVQQGPLRNDVAAKKASLTTAETNFTALGNLTELGKIQAQQQALKNRMEYRALFSTQLDIFRDLIPTNCQLTAFRTTRTMSTFDVQVDGMVTDPEGKKKPGKVNVKKQVPTLELTVEISTRAATKVDVYQIGDDLKSILQKDARLHEWAKPFADGKGSNTWNLVTGGISSGQDSKPGEASLGIFEFKIPIALKDEPKNL